MSKNVFPVVALALGLSLTPTTESVAQTPPGDFVLNHAQHFTLNARANGRAYQIFVSRPQGDAPPQGFPIIYVVDGNAMFPQFAATANLLRMNERAVIVGIGYPGDGPFDSARRYFDFTPKTPEAVLQASGRAGAARETGGHDLFIDVIEKEVKPWVERQTRIDRSRQTLFGHSLGGLFVLHVLYNRPECFQNYVAAAPSVWWNNQSVLQEERAFRERHKQGRSLSVNVLITSNTDPTRRRPTPNQAQGGNATRGQEEAENLGGLVESLKTLPGVTAQYKVFEDETHISMVSGSVNSALRFVLGDARRSQGAPPPDAARGGNSGGSTPTPR